METKSILVITIALLLIVNSGLIILPVSADDVITINNITPFSSPYGMISVNATSLEGINSLPLYHGSFGRNGSINLQLQQIGKERQNVTTVSEAPFAAEKVLEDYGGLPRDAVLNGASTTYSEIYNHTLEETTFKEPMFTTVSYSRELDGFWVYGDSNTIILTLGENGELLWIFKVWRDYTCTGEARIIPVYGALEKLRLGEVLNSPMVSGEKITIDIATPDYYAKEIGNNETKIEPIWLLVGTTESGSRVGFYVYARQFANFTATPTTVSINDTITFTDLSDASPERWLWDFGDGTNSTLRNPTHSYKTGGTYTVNLTAWNDLGSDTISRTDLITVHPGTKPVAGFMSNFTWDNRKPPLAVLFSDTSSGTITNWSWDFGDGTNSTEQNPTHIFTLPTDEIQHSYPVSLTVTDTVGRNSSFTEWVYLYKGFVPNFTAEPVTGTAPLNVTFTDTTKDGDQLMGLVWDFGEGEEEYYSEYPLPVTTYHTYSREGTFTVTFTCYGPFEDRYSITKEFLVTVQNASSLPVSDFSANSTSGKAPLAVAFSDLSSGSPGTWDWSFGDGGTSADRNPEHVYTGAGNYSVSLKSGNAYGENTTTKIDFISVSPLAIPAAGFTADPVYGTVPLKVFFNDSSIGSPTGWLWDFGDGTTSFEQNPVHEYGTEGIYTVSLTATNYDGSDTETHSEYITVTSPELPVAEFAANTTSGMAPLAVGFTDLSSGSPTGWTWVFGDGGTSDEQNPVHVYSTTGRFTVSLEVTNPEGSNATTMEEFIIVSSGTRPPVANFSGKPTCGQAPLTVMFTDSSTGSPDSWFWDFGDGSNTTTQNPVHVFTAAGKYSVTLTTTNSGGINTSMRKEYISVTGSSIRPPVANFNARPISGKAPLSVKFTDASTRNPAEWYWEFGDGTNATVRNPVHSYNEPGKYTVSLTVTNVGGSDRKTREDYIRVKGSQLPQADFSGKPTSGKAPLSVRFSDESTGNPAAWYWEFGDGTNETVRNPVHSYTIPGKYTVSLKVTNAVGDTTKTRLQYISVRAPLAPSPTHTTRPVTTCTTRPTTTCTPKPTMTTTQNPCMPYKVPLVKGSITDDRKVRLDWDVIPNPCLQGYKVVISKNNPAPKYPEDGYLFWITDRNTTSSVISSTDRYYGGDFGGYLRPGQKYYFSITAVYPEAKVAGNSLVLEYPG